MKTIKLLLAIVTATTLNLKFGTLNCKAQTLVPAGAVSGTWTLAGSPYNVQGSISIPNGTTLTIQPGVTINFQGHYKLNVQGRLLAIGTATDTIIFTATNTTDGWGGIRFDHTSATNDTSKFFYSKLQYGKANGTYPFNQGGAFYFATSSKAIISNSLITNNSTIYEGGAIYCESSNPTINMNTISNNTGSQYGGGVFCYNSNSIITNNVIAFNTASSMGGGVFCSGDFSNSPNISNNIISNNTASNSGGGIYSGSGGGVPIISNNIISNNFAGDGGGIYFEYSSCPVSNNTISNNNATNGGAVYCWSSTPTFTNCLLWSNTASNSGNQVFLMQASNPNFYYNDVQGGLAAFEIIGNTYIGSYLNNMDSDPLFVSPSGGSGAGFNGVAANWQLQLGSLCIDTGDPATNTSSLDIIGNPRINNCRIDMGAYENQSGTLFAVTISQTSPILCFGNTTGALQATTSGAGSPFTYFWSPGGATTSSISNLGAGTYNVTATNSNGCFTNANLAITQPPTMSLFTSKTDINCQGQCNGSAIVTDSGGIGPITYLWNTFPAQNSSATSATLCIGTYSVTVTDSIGCAYTTSVTIGDDFAFSLIPSTTDASCNNNDGSASITATSDSANYSYSYQWSNGSTNQNLTAIGSGTYIVTVTDNNSCAVSNTLIVNTLAPSSIPICMVTVDSSSTKNVIVWEKPISALIDSFKVYREVSSVYSHVGSVHYNDVSEFIDNASGINPNTTSYKYKLSVLDTCGNESALSTEHHTIHVQLSLAFPQGVNLNWNNYGGFSFSQYRILRDDLGNGNWQVIDSVSFGTSTYTSPDVLPNAGYIVEATRPTACVSTRQSGTTRNSSKSNTALKQTIGVNELLNDLSIIISPNPSNGKFTIELSNSGISNNNKFAVKIYNVLGVQVYLSELKPLTHNEIDLSNVPKGIYFVNVYNGDKIYTRKIVKQ